MSLQNSRREMYQKLLSFEQGRTANNWSISWAGRAITIGHGVDNAGATIGHYDITLPPVGTVLTGINIADVTVTADGIPLTSWQTLYYIPQTRTSNASDPANFRICSYNTNFVLPDNALMIAHRVGSACIKWGDDMGFTDKDGKLKTSQEAEFDYQAYADGLTRVSLAGEVSWTGIIRTMSPGRTSQEPSGYHDITMPPVGTVIPGNGISATVTAATAGSINAPGGIPLAAWETLWYRIVDGSAQTSVAANFRIQRYTAASDLLETGDSEANDWVKIVSRDANDKFHWHFNGDAMQRGGIAVGSASLMNANAANLYRNWDHSGFAFVGFNESLVAFGLTGRLRFLGGGQEERGNVHGYVDIDPAERAAGRAIIGVGVADTAWRTVAATDQVEWFGGILANSVNPVNTAATVVDLAVNQQLYWAYNPASPANSGNWYITNSAQETAPANWLLIAARDDATGDFSHQARIPYANELLKRGEAKFGSKSDSAINAIHDAKSIMISGWYTCRFSAANHFSGTASNAVINGSSAVLVAWEDNTIMYGAGAGYELPDLNYHWMNVPPVGTEIPVVGYPGRTRRVETIAGFRYVPLGIWEYLWYIPGRRTGSTSSVTGAWVISYISSGSVVDNGALLVLRGWEAIRGNGRDSTSVRLLDQIDLKPGISLAVGTPTNDDHAQGTWRLWRNIRVAGETPPAATAAIPAITGVSRYAGNYNPQYRMVSDELGGMRVRLRGLINATQPIAGNAMLAFIPGAWLTTGTLPIPLAYINTSNGPISFGVRLGNETIGGQNGVSLRVETGELEAGGPRWAGNPTRRWICLDGIEFVTY